MPTVIETLYSLFKNATLAAYPSLSDPGIEITQTTNDKFGDYQFNSAMKLSKLAQSPPRQIAETILYHLQKEPVISKVEIAGPGFVNITIDPSYLATRMNELLHDPLLGINKPEKSLRVIIDFSAPNTAKEMHVGHLRSTIIGDCLARVFEFSGHDVLRLNHIGDWGTAFGMLISHMKKNVPEVLSGSQTTTLQELVHWYRASKQHFDTNPEFKKNSQLEVVALQSGDPESLKAWSIICDISRKAYQEIYDLLDIKLIERGESFYNPMLGDTVAELESKGLVQISDGAKCIFLEGFSNREGEPLPLMVQKSDGAYNYDTTDMAAIKHRIQTENGDRLIYVTDAGQGKHFEMVFKAAEKAGYLDPAKVKVDHVPFGLVLGSDGKKFKTRSGDTERLIDLIYAAVNESEKIIAKRSPEMDSVERKELAHALGVGAIKYADLSCNRTGDYAFSYDRMLRFEGNTAAFLMYSYVRAEGIKRKMHADMAILLKTDKIQIGNETEKALAMHLAQFGETIQAVERELLPNRLTDYLYGLAEKFNAFYRDCPVDGSAEKNSRLLLCEAVALVMKQGLSMLGVRTVEKM